jgi:hypothetical protein
MDHLEQNAAKLEHGEIALRQDVHHTQELLVRAVASIELEMHSLKTELLALEGEMQSTIDRAKKVVGQYKGVVKRGDMMRLQNRADVWAPEKRITREQFKRLIE